MEYGPDGPASVHIKPRNEAVSFRLSSRRGGAHGICLCRATFAERLLTLDSRVLSRLVLDLPIQFRADQNYNGGNPQPHHQADCGPKRAVGRVVIGEVTQIPREQYRADQPRTRSDTAPDRQPLPARFSPAWPIALQNRQPHNDEGQQEGPP
jgi:hypothetical protein